MFKKILKDNKGLTFVELMVAIAVIAIISSMFVINIQESKKQQIERYNQKMAADVRYVRNLAISRTVHQFSGQTEEEAIYPPGGYGVFFTQNPTPDRYYVYADNGNQVGFQWGQDEWLSYVDLQDLEIIDKNNTNAGTFYFAFSTENEINTNMTQSSNSQFIVQLREEIESGTGLQGTLKLGEYSNDGYIWSNLGEAYGTFHVHQDPDPDPDPIIIRLLQ